MASLEKVLASMDEMDYIEDYLKDNIQYVIDENLRTITIPTNGVVLGVVGDKNSNRVNFMMNKDYNGFDMSSWNTRINYVNANGDANYYTVTDKTVVDDKIVFSWLVDSDAVVYQGSVNFIVYMFKTNTSGTITQSFNSSIATARVLEGLSVDSYVAPEDVEDILSRLESNATTTVNTAKTNAVTAVNTAKTEATTAIATDKAAALTAIGDKKTEALNAVSSIDSKKTEALSAIATDKSSALTAIENKRASSINEMETKRTTSIASIPDDYTSFYNEAVKMSDEAISDCNAFTTTGFAKTAQNYTLHLPTEVIGTFGEWGVISCFCENSEYGTGTQMYYPVNGVYAGRVFTRSILDMNTTPQPSEWRLVTVEEDLNKLASGCYPIKIFENEYFEKDGSIDTYEGWSRSNYLPIFDDKITLKCTHYTEYCCFFDENKDDAIESFTLNVGTNVIDVPEGANYFGVSNYTENLREMEYVHFVLPRIDEVTSDVTQLKTDIDVLGLSIDEGGNIIDSWMEEE